MSTAGRRAGTKLFGPGLLRVLLGNPSLAWVIAAFAAVTVAEWGYVTALAEVDALRRDGTFAVGLVGLRLLSVLGTTWPPIGLAGRAPGRQPGRESRGPTPSKKPIDWKAIA